MSGETVIGPGDGTEDGEAADIVLAWEALAVREDWAESLHGDLDLTYI
jgi:hypothetical protein